MTMSFVYLPPSRSVSQGPRFAEHSSVELVRELLIDGRALPKETRGTIVGVYADGKGYEVEFDRPFHAVVTLDVDDLVA